MPQKTLNEEVALEYIAGRTEGRLATVDADGAPYITPLNYVFYAGKIYFHCATSGRKLDNIAADNRVCFEVSHTEKAVFAEKPCACATRYMSALVFGKAHVVADSGEKVAALNALIEKFSQGRPYQPVNAELAATCAVVAVEIEKISGKQNVDAF